MIFKTYDSEMVSREAWAACVTHSCVTHSCFTHSCVTHCFCNSRCSRAGNTRWLLLPG